MLREGFYAQDTITVRGRPLLIHTENDAVRHLGQIIGNHDIDKAVFIYDPNVPREFLRQCAACLGRDDPAFIRLPYAGEATKSLAGIQLLLDRISPLATRDSSIISVGGGATSNAAGMVAGLLYRGVKLIHIPTTTLAQADAAIGLKQAVNSTSSKNIYGLYHQPLAVLNDLRVLSALTTDSIRDGLAEVAKVGLSISLEIYNLLLMRADPRIRTILPEPDLGRALHTAATVKLRGLSEDPYEVGDLRLMELGHVTAHTLETSSCFRISHGTAVAAGLAVEARYSVELGVAKDRDLVQTFQALLSDRLGFQKIRNAPGAAAFEAALANSNKRSAQGIEIILPIQVGMTSVSTVTDQAQLTAAYRTSRIFAD